MSIAKVGGGHVQATQRNAHDYERRQLGRAKVGQEVSLRILERLADGRYVASFGNERYTVESALRLNIGQTVKATVSAVGEIVELKYVGAGQFEIVDAPATATPGDAKSQTVLERLQTKYKVPMSATERALAQKFGEQVEHSETAAIGALFLRKLDAPLEDVSMRALYEAQVWDEKDDSNSSADTPTQISGSVDVSSLISGVQAGNQKDIESLAKVLGDAVEQSLSVDLGAALATQIAASSGDQAAFDTHDSTRQDGNALKELASRLLNMQDLGTVAYHYGTLPILIADQLVELDLVLFRDRRGSGNAATTHRLVMTLKTETLGRVEIVAQSVDSSLSVSIGTQSPQATELLASHASEVRELATRLGWNVESVAYRLATEPARAAEQIVKHVLNAGTLDAVI